MWDRRLRRRVIEAIARGPSFRNPDDARNFTQHALSDLKYDERPAILLKQTGSTEAIAHRVVLDAFKYRSPDGTSYLESILEEDVYEAHNQSAAVLD